MALSTIIGKGSPELVRFWGEPQIVREPETVLFGVARLDPPEQEFLTKSPVRHILAADIQAKGVEKSTQQAIEQFMRIRGSLSCTWMWT